MFRGDAAHSGVSQERAPQRLHGVLWRFRAGGRVVSSPVFSQGVLYFGSDDGNLYAVDAQTGEQRWKYTTGGPVPSTPAVSGDLVLFGSYDGRFYALSSDTGVLRWRFDTGGERRFEARGLHGLLPRTQTFSDPFDVFLSSPVVADGRVFFGSGDGKVYALDVPSGALKWAFQTGDVVHASPAYSEGTVFVGSWDGSFYALDAASGKERWRFKGGEDPLIHNQVGFQSSPAVMGGVVYTGCRDSNLYALDAASGAEKWRVNNAGSWVVSSPAVADGKVFFATSDSSLYHVVDAETGRSLLEKDTKAYVFSSPAVAGSVVLVGVLNGTLEARDRESGDLLWDFRTEASERNAGWVLTGERRFNTPILFYSPWREAGVLAAEAEFSVGSFFSTPLIQGGVVFVGSADGSLYALS